MQSELCGVPGWPKTPSVALDVPHSGAPNHRTLLFTFYAALEDLQLVWGKKRGQNVGLYVMDTLKKKNNFSRKSQGSIVRNSSKVTFLLSGGV